MAQSAAKAKSSARRSAARYVVCGMFLFFGAVGLIYGAQQFEQFLITDPRFVLVVPTDYGQESPSLHIDGIRYAPRKQVLRVFAGDLGHSAYLLPLADRQRALLRVSWVKEATVVRLWPNQVMIHVVERQPAAFLEFKNDEISRWALIDPDGAILDPPDRSSFHLPVLTGVVASDPQALRGVKVRRMQGLLKELGPLGDNVSEVDVSDLDDLKVTQQMQDHAIVLILGDRNFRSRLQHFIDHYPDIQRRMPNATVLDLRLDDRITVVQGVPNGA